jgi:nitrite reductase (NADH) small subunit
MKNTSTKRDERWVRIADCESIPLREGRAVKIGALEIAIFNLGERFLAIDNICPHKGGPLADGIVSGTTVICPLHAWKLSLETGHGVNSASAAGCIATYRTRIEQGIVWLELPITSAAMNEIPGACIEQNQTLQRESNSGTL